MINIFHRNTPVLKGLTFRGAKYRLSKIFKLPRPDIHGDQCVVGHRGRVGVGLMVKVRQVEKFFAQGHPVEVVMRLRGREKRNKDWAMEKLLEFLELIPVEYKKLNEPRFLGNGPAVQIAKK